jgi:galactitol-specific phosphotransferase system IIB component
MKLRLNGAFDRLIKYSKSLNNPFALGADTSTQLSQVIEGCLRDLELKLKAIALNGGSSEQEIEQVRIFISSITEQSAILDIEELLPKIMSYLKQCKYS